MWLSIQIFGFRGLWSPYFILFLLGLALIYYLVTGPYRHKFTDATQPTRRQQIFFYSGLLLVYIVKGSPVDLLSHIMLTAHMIQTALLYFLFPILLIKGIPKWMWEKIVYAPVIKHVIKLFTKPLIALLLFNGALSLYHMPAIFDYSKTSQTAHATITIALLILAIFMWWPILTPIKEFELINPLLKMGYLIGSATMITVACALIIFSDNLLFTAYSSEGAWIKAMSLCVPVDVLEGLEGVLSGPEMFSPMSALHDQQLGGVVMQITQQIVYGIVIARIFFRWFGRRSEDVDPIPNDPMIDPN